MYEEAPAADPRALLSAAALGSIAGLLLGGVYMMSGRIASAPSLGDARPLVAQAAPAAHEAVALSAPRKAQLRWLHFAAQPFEPSAESEADDAVLARDRQCLTQAVYYEARGEVAAGQAAVAQVVLNRVRHPAFPKSVCAVVFQRNADGCQFSFACEGRPAIGRDAVAWRRAGEVADRALDGFVMRQIGHATHFHVFNIETQWSQSLARVAQIGAHVFYGFTRRPAATAQPARGEPATAIAQAAEPPTPAPMTLASLAPPPKAEPEGPVASATALSLAPVAAPSQEPVTSTH